MQVERDHAVNAGGLEEVCHQSGGDGLTAGGLAVLTSVAVVGDDRREALRACAGGGVSHDEGLHDEVVHVLAGDGLDEEDLVAADGLLKAGINLAVGELLDLEALKLEVEDVCDVLGELGVAGTGVKLDFLLVGVGLLRSSYIDCRPSVWDLSRLFRLFAPPR